MDTPITQDLIDALTTPGPQTESLLRSIPFDVLYKIVTEYLPSKSIVKLCQTSSYFNRRLCQSEDLWHHLYEQDISVLRVPSEGGLPPNWRLAYFQVATDIRDKSPNEVLEIATKNGYEKLAETAITQGATNFNRGLRLASAGGYRDIVDRMLALGATDYKTAMAMAANRGHREIVDQMISLDPKHTNLNFALLRASAGGQRGMVDHLISQGANNLAGAFTEAVRGGHRDVIDLLIQRGALPTVARDQFLERSIALADQAGYRDIANYLRSLLSRRHPWRSRR